MFTWDHELARRQACNDIAPCRPIRRSSSWSSSLQCNRPSVSTTGQMSSLSSDSDALTNSNNNANYQNEKFHNISPEFYFNPDLRLSGGFHAMSPFSPNEKAALWSSFMSKGTVNTETGTTSKSSNSSSDHNDISATAGNKKKGTMDARIRRSPQARHQQTVEMICRKLKQDLEEELKSSSYYYNDDEVEVSTITGSCGDFQTSDTTTTTTTVTERKRLRRFVHSQDGPIKDKPLVLPRHSSASNEALVHVSNHTNTTNDTGIVANPTLNGVNDQSPQQRQTQPATTATSSCWKGTALSHDDPGKEKIDDESDDSSTSYGDEERDGFDMFAFQQDRDNRLSQYSVKNRKLRNTVTNDAEDEKDESTIGSESKGNGLLLQEQQLSSQQQEQRVRRIRHYDEDDDDDEEEEHYDAPDNRNFTASFDLLLRDEENSLVSELTMQDWELRGRRLRPSNRFSSITIDESLRPRYSILGPTVTFQEEVQVRHYERIVELNPACSEGIPIGIGWNYYTTRTSIDYNKTATHHKSLEQLRISPKDRLNLLMELGYTHEEIDTAMKLVEKAQGQRFKTVLNLANEFDDDDCSNCNEDNTGTTSDNGSPGNSMQILVGPKTKQILRFGRIEAYVKGVK